MVHDELFDKARRYNALFMEREHRHALGRVLAFEEHSDESLYVELCSLMLQVKDGLRAKAKAESA